jgi:hypothetical protein
VEGTAITDHAARRNVAIPRIPTTPSDYPFKFKIIHVPVRRSFAMIINKSQGESLKIVGLGLENPCSATREQVDSVCLLLVQERRKTVFNVAENGKAITVL